MYQYRQILVRMRQGDSDRDIARSKTMGRKKLAEVRETASELGSLAPECILPDDTALAAVLAKKETLHNVKCFWNRSPNCKKAVIVQNRSLFIAQGTHQFFAFFCF